jgi:uncharacterized protein
MNIPPELRATSPSASARILSAAELLLGAAIVIGHNIYRIIPNEVLVLFIVGWISVWVRDGGWKTLGLRRPESWKLTIAIAAGAAVLRVGIGDYVLVPAISSVFPAPVESSTFDDLAGNLKLAFLALLLVWTFAAFGEEMVYRGYLLTRAADLGRRSSAAYWIAVLLVAILFGCGHYYKGVSGVIDSGFAGLVLGSAYVLSKRNMWVPILAHGLIDTFAIVWTFFGGS